MIMKKLLFPLLFVLVFAGCNKSEQPDWSHFYRYFPMDEGHWVVYSVDSTSYNKLLDTVIHYHYRVRETLADELPDLSGTLWRRVIREEMRDTSSGTWQISGVNAQKVNRSSADKLEQNQRFIKLIFPFRKSLFWKGNSYIHYEDPYNCNYLGEWNFQYTDLYHQATLFQQMFDSVITIRQVADSGLICKNLAVEQYAPGIGLIYKHTERLTTQNTSADPFWIRAEQGFIVTYRITGWGK
jgi:hypothetical protein